MLQNIDAVILCGGLGKRLRSVIGDRQKVFAQLNGEPFLDIILRFLKKQGIKRVILLTGFGAEEIEGYYQNKSFGLEISFSKEKTPLGTGGAIKKAKRLIHSNTFFLLNGDSICLADLKELLQFHQQKKSLATVVVSSVEDSKDYGGIVMDKDSRITAFVEKGSGVRLKNVNAGIYCFDKSIFSSMPKKNKFSMEYDFFPKLINKNFYGFKTKRKFYDIGTPERFAFAQEVLGVS